MPASMVMTRRQSVLLVAPPVLVASTWWMFHALTKMFGLVTGYLAGFLCYWIGWCLAFPVALVGWRRALRLFAGSERLRLRASDRLLLLLPLLLGFGYAFPRAIAGSSITIILVSAVVALVNAPLEELLWRGAFLQLFPDSWILGYGYPAVMFGVWHLAPLSVIPNRSPGGSVSFVIVSVVLGLMWGWVARRTRSIRSSSIAHVLFDFSGLGGRLYVR
jgi:membrane protease YdiL (CAAX protease family)